MRGLVWLAIVLVACEGGEQADAGIDAGEVRIDGGTVELCERASDCADGRFCNGMEECAPGANGADPRTGCIAGTPPCASGTTCDEEGNRCGSDCTDADDDGQTTCEGDCNDSNPLIFRGAQELCEPNDASATTDEDCNPLTFGDRDRDADGAIDRACVNVDVDTATPYRGTDCNDDAGGIHPMAREVCEGSADENCDGNIDERCPCTPLGSTQYCANQMGVCLGSQRTCTESGWGPCDRNPSPELCDGPQLDEDCDNMLNEGCECAAGDTRECGMGACRGRQSCEAGRWSACNGAAPATEVCDGVDNDCDGLDDSADPSVAGVGNMQCGTDVGVCEFGNRTSCVGTALVCSGPAYVAPQVNDSVCDHQDNDCDGQIDENGFAEACTQEYSGGRGMLCYPGGQPCQSWALTGPAANGYRGMFTSWRGDLGRDNLFWARAFVRDTSPGSASPPSQVSFVLSPRAVEPSSRSLPFLTSDERALAVTLETDLGRVAFSVHRRLGWRAFHIVTIPAECAVVATETEYYFVLGNTGSRFFLNLRFNDQCSWSYEFDDSELWNEMYGPGPTYPQYHLGMVSLGDADLRVLVNVMGTTRRPMPGDRNNCIGCR